MDEKLWDRAAGRAARTLLTQVQAVQQLRMAAPAAAPETALCEIASVYAFGDRRYPWCEVEAWLARRATRRADSEQAGDATPS